MKSRFLFIKMERFVRFEIDARAREAGRGKEGREQAVTEVDRLLQ